MVRPVTTGGTKRRRRWLLAGALIACAATVLLFALWRVDPSPPSAGGADSVANRSEGTAAAAPPAVASSGAAAPVSAETSNEDCLAALLAPSSSSVLLQTNKRHKIDGLLRESGLGQLEREIAADLAGLRSPSPTEYSTREETLPPELFLRYGTPPPATERTLSPNERHLLEKQLATEGVRFFFTATLSQASWDARTSVAGHLVREHGKALFSALRDGRAPIRIGIHELAVAIVADVAVEDFLVLLDASAIDPKTTWRNGVNLAKLAAIRLRPKLLRELLSRGVDPTVEPGWRAAIDGYRSALDDLAWLPPPAEPSQLNDVVAELVAAGDQPYLPSTLATLGEWRPDAPLPPLHADAAVALANANVASTAALLSSEVARWTAEVDAATRLEERCGHALAAAEPAAFAGKGLVAKQRHQEALAKRYEAWLDGLRRTVAAEAEETAVQTPEQAEAMERLMAAIAAGDWVAAQALASPYPAGDMVLLLIALGSNPPADALLAIVERNGGRLPEDAILDLARNDRGERTNMARLLEPYGLDAGYVDAEGRNAWSVLAKWGWDGERTVAFAEFLRAKAVPVKATAFGLDALDIVLLRLLETPRLPRETGRMARLFIDAGAQVELSHRQLLQAIADANAEAYRILVEAVPELGVL